MAHTDFFIVLNTTANDGEFGWTTQTHYFG